MSQRIHNQMYGTTERRDFSQIKDVLPIPYLIEVQKNSYANSLMPASRKFSKIILRSLTSPAD